jgi:hypothetical protein
LINYFKFFIGNLLFLKPHLQKRQKRRDKLLGEELIECARYYSLEREKGGYNIRVKKADYAHARKQESMKFMHGSEAKSFNDNLGR